MSGADCRALGTAPFREAAKERSCLLRARAGDQRSTPKKSGGKLESFDWQGEQLSRLNAGSAGPYAREMSTIRALVRYQSWVAGKRSDGDYVLHRGPAS